MKKIRSLVILIFISGSGISQDSIMPILNQMFPAFELKSDLAFIKNKAMYKRFKNDGLIYVGKERFNQLYDSIEKVIDEKGKMSRLEFYFLTAPIVQSLQDDHSYYGLDGKYCYNPKDKTYFTFAEKSLIPIRVGIFHDSVIMTLDSTDLYKSQIISINNIPANKIVSDIFRYTLFGDNRYYSKYKYGYLGIYSQSILTYALYGFHDEVEVVYSPLFSNTILKKQLSLLPIEDSSFYRYIEQKRASYPWYTVKFEREMAILKFNSLPDEPIKIHILNDIFKSISNIKSKSLIIDISNCYWSYDPFWILLLNYFIEGDIEIFEFQDKEVDLKRFTKKKIKKANFFIGKFFDINTNYKFIGDIYLITGPSTASAAVRFADILKHNNIIKRIYGSETLSKKSQYDYTYTHYLPVTGLKLRLSMTFFYALDKNMDTHGIIPDVEVKPNTIEEFWDNGSNRFVIKKVIDLVEKENLENENTTHK